MFSNIRQLNFHRRQTSGVALVVTLTMLAIVALLAIAFVMTARTELKSGSAYSDQVAAKGLAKMAVDRALMEIVRQNAAYIISGAEYSNVIVGAGVSTNVFLNYFTNNPAILGNNDYSCIDNYTNDVNPLYGITTNGATLITNSFDFVERDGVLGRSAIEPYWISVRNAQGILVGRFAFVGMGNAVDINAIGNIAGTGDTYLRPADTNFGYGYIGALSTNALGATNYTRGICADVSLQKFLAKLGYGGAGSTYTPAQAAQRILWFRYGCPAGSLSTLFSPGTYMAGAGSISSPIDNNNDGVNNNPSEYTVTPSVVGDDQAIGSLSQLDALPNPIAPDPANGNLADYAFVGPSADPNLVNPYIGARVNLNAMTNGTSAILATNVMILTNILAQFPQFTNNLIQLALNLIDFHTTNLYPSVFTNIIVAPLTTNILTGVKATPYLNQILIRYDTSFYRSTNFGGAAVNKTNYWFTTSVTVSNELWNPYSNYFPDTNNVVITNMAVIYTNTTAAQPVRVSYVVSCSFTSPAPGYTINYSPFATNVYKSSALGFSNVLCTGYYSNWVSGLTVPGAVVITNIFVQATLFGTNAVSPTNLIQRISTPVTNIITVPWPGSGVAWNAFPWNAGGAGQTNSAVVTNCYISLEADDPRMGILYNQTAGGPGYALGGQNTTCSPTAPNASTGYPDTGNREGIASFYVQTNGYLTVGDIGYVHRGEPWTTIRLQSYSNFVSAVSYPYGDGKLMDYFRVNELIDVAGRININSDTNGVVYPGCFNGGINQSPALFALFSGITNSAYLSPGNAIDGNDDTKITAIINDMGAYRAGLTNGNMLYIGQMCALPNLTTDLSGSPIPYTNDAGREALIRAISNLITAWKGGGTTQIIGWGQVVKGGGTGISNGVPGAVVAIQVTFKNVGGRVKLTSYQYLSQ